MKKCAASNSYLHWQTYR